ncbi:MAG TPA: HXXEE domain-containing protein [Pyrinomonadaceae bacterium]|nr:HXXEE domain-containing protein [Pyrinomonadaceae bacterium]
MASVSTNSARSSRARLFHRHWVAWIGLCGALAIHVADEALTDFLALYNPTVLAIRQRYPSLPLPTFTFEVWLSYLIFAIVALTAVSFFVWKGRWAMRPISYVFAGFMLLNGLLHIAGSFYMGTFMSGVYSSPLLLAASILLIVRTADLSRSRKVR